MSEYEVEEWVYGVFLDEDDNTFVVTDEDPNCLTCDFERGSSFYGD